MGNKFEKQVNGSATDLDNSLGFCNCDIRLELYSGWELRGGKRENGVDQKTFDRLADTETPQGILAVCALQYESVPSKNKRYVLLDGLQDPGNAGTIIRSAVAFGYEGVIVTPGCVDLFSPKVVRATMGALFQCSVVMLDDLSVLKDYPVIAADLDGQDIESVRLDDHYILAIGREAQGISPALRPWVTLSITIPLRNQTVDSLNAAVAAGIAMYRLTRRSR